MTRRKRPAPPESTGSRYRPMRCPHGFVDGGKGLCTECDQSLGEVDAEDTTAARPDLIAKRKSGGEVTRARMVEMLSAPLAKRARRNVKGWFVSNTGHSLLQMIASQPGMSNAALAAELNTTLNCVEVTVFKLRRQGYIEGLGRYRGHGITDSGRALCAELDENVALVEEAVRVRVQRAAPQYAVPAELRCAATNVATGRVHSSARVFDALREDIDDRKLALLATLELRRRPDGGVRFLHTPATIVLGERQVLVAITPSVSRSGAEVRLAVSKGEREK